VTNGRDFWISSGHHLLERDSNGELVATDDFLKVYLAREELLPPPEACVAERTIYSALLSDPRCPVSAEKIASISDSDARENWAYLIALRDKLIAHGTIERAYMAIVREKSPSIPPIFINQLVHVILRNALDECDEAEVVRAGELLFRPQRLTLHEGSLLSADDEVIGGIRPSLVTPLVSMLGIPAEANIDVLGAQNADEYWERSDQFDMALNLTAGQSGHAALARVLEAWIAHLMKLDVEIEPVTALHDVSFDWFVGLDAEATSIGNALWKGDDLDEAAQARVVNLFRLSFRDPAMMIERVRGAPVYLILAMTPDKILRVKPQNLLTGLPVRQLDWVT
jgi:hypothetical protein